MGAVRSEQPFFDKPIFFTGFKLRRCSWRARARCPAVPASRRYSGALTGWLGAQLISAGPASSPRCCSPSTRAVRAGDAILDTLFTAFLPAASAIAVAAMRDLADPAVSGYLLIAGAVMTKGPLAFSLRPGDGVVDRHVRGRAPPVARLPIAGAGPAVAISAPWFV